MLTTLTALALFACQVASDDSGATRGGDPDVRWGSPETVDSDLDGYSPAQGDCDDDDPDTYPGATDVWYDGIDSDCGGEDDYDQDGDGLPSWSYAPGLDPNCANDVDGYEITCDCDDDGDLYAPSECDTRLRGGDKHDCDDGDANRNPGMMENNTNGVDDNCNDGVDNYSIEVTWGGGNVVAAVTDNFGWDFRFLAPEGEEDFYVGTGTSSWEATFPCEEIPGNCTSPEDVTVVYLGSYGAVVVSDLTPNCVTWGPERSEPLMVEGEPCWDISHLVERDGNTWYWDGVYSPPSE